MNPLDFKELYKNNPRSAQLKLKDFLFLYRYIK